MSRFLLKKTSVLVTLAILSPLTQADVIRGVSDTPLNLNYTRKDNTSRFLIQSTSCHSRSDPMEIQVNFSPMITGNSFIVTLELNGKKYTKNYAPFTASSTSVKTPTISDRDFSVPWGVTLTGNASGNEQYDKTIAGTPGTPGKIKYEGLFCFASNHTQHGLVAGGEYSFTGGYMPIYFTGTPPSNCGDHRKGSSPLPNPGYIQWRDYNKPDDDNINGQMWSYRRDRTFWLDHIFYKSRTEVGGTKPTSTTTIKDWKPFNYTPNKEHCVTEKCVYTFPTGRDNKGINLTTAGFTLKLDNRNISSMKLIINQGGPKPEVWEWEVDPDYGNKLVLKKKGNMNIISDNLASPGMKDPYEDRGFYKNSSLYKGTLAAMASLKQGYNAFDKITPLSLPADANEDGHINLVNTENLFIRIEQSKGINVQGANAFGLKIYGEPLKFAPVYINPKNQASALQLKNACY